MSSTCYKTGAVFVSSLTEGKGFIVTSYEALNAKYNQLTNFVVVTITILKSNHKGTREREKGKPKMCNKDSVPVFQDD